MVINFRHGDLPGLHSFLQGVTVEEFTWLLVIEARCRCLGSAVGCAPIGYDKALEVPVFLQDVHQQKFVLAGVVSVHAVVGAHYGCRIRHLQTDFEREQIALAHRPLVDVDVNGVASALLIIQRVVLDVADDVLGLLALHHPSHHRAGEDRIFAHVFEGAPIARLASQIHAATQRHVVSLGAKFTSDESSVFVGGVRVPARGGAQIRRQGRRIAPILSAASDTIRGIRHLNARNAEAWNRNHVARTAIGVHSQRA